MQLSPDAVNTLLTSLFPSGMIDDLARECDAVERDRNIDVRLLVWTLTVGFAVDGEARSIAEYRRAYNAATNQSLVASSFYNRLSQALHELRRQLLEHALEDVAVPHHESSTRNVQRVANRTLYRARWEVELLFRELKSRYSLEEFETSKEHIVKIQIVAALLTLW